MKSKKRPPAATALAIRNDILRALLSSEYQHLRPKLEQVDLEFGCYFVARCPTVEELCI